jgi:hypothetical protein
MEFTPGQCNRATRTRIRVLYRITHKRPRHTWEKATDTTRHMPSVQLFLAKYPIWKFDLKKPLEYDKYDFYDYQLKQMETNFNMTKLEEFDEAQNISMDNTAERSYWVNKQGGIQFEMSKIGSNVPKHLLLDIQSPKDYVVLTKRPTIKSVPFSDEYLTLKAEINNITKAKREIFRRID